MNLEGFGHRFSPELLAYAQARLNDHPWLAGVDVRPPATTGEAPLEALGTRGRLDALEAIVKRFGRPALLIQDDRIILEALPDFPIGTDGLIKNIEGWVTSVGRINLTNSSHHYGGTCWIAERIDDHTALVFTNRHVVQLFAARRSDGSGGFRRAWDGSKITATVDFRAEAGSRATNHTAKVIAVEYLAEDIAADVALLRIQTPDGFAMPSALKLSTTPPRKGDLVGLIGYPGFDYRNNAADQSRYFNDLYEVKRFSPGLVMQDAADGATLSHDCTSLGGASGGTLLSLKTGEVVGLHFAGIEGERNSAVTAPTLAALLRGERPYTVTTGGGDEGLADGFHDASHFKGRAGFDTGFLEIAPTPWPSLDRTLAAGLAEPSDSPPEPHELRYTHFGVKYHGKLRLPLVTAVNIDGGRAFKIKRGADKWFADGRIPTNIQLRKADFADHEIDRGHMVRREDPNWGPTDGAPGAQEAEARLADADTFHYVNSAPQHSRLNQGKAFWQGLENYILDSARTHGFRACVFTGPVIPEDHQKITEIDGALAPDEFWKLVATQGDEGAGLRATAYILTQGEMLRELMEKRSRRESLEGFALGTYRTFQVSVRTLAEATRHDFSAYVKHDPLETQAESLSDPTVPKVRPLQAYEDIQF